MDVLRYFERLARPYVLLQEIELALRELIDQSLSAPQLERCVERALREHYKERYKKEPPSKLADMTFEDYRLIITTRDNWERFKGVLGQNRDLVSIKLERIRRIRNDVFHFRDSVSIRDHQDLASDRFWLFDKARSLRERIQQGPTR